MALVAASSGVAAASPAVELNRLLALIRAVEAPAGYDDYYRGVSAPPPRLLTSMTIGEVLAWQDRIDPHSISEASGGYQIMEDTLRDLVARYGLDPAERYSPQVQDYLATRLIDESGWVGFQRGEISAAAFGDRLARVWAGLPRLTGPARGRSAYHGLAGNRALIPAEMFEAALEDLGAFDIETIRHHRGSNAPAPPRVAAPSEDPGFGPSVVVTWSSDPFYLD